MTILYDIEIIRQQLYYFRYDSILNIFLIISINIIYLSKKVIIYLLLRIQKQYSLHTLVLTVQVYYGN